MEREEQKRRALFIVTSDPRESGRPAEALRIAAGIAVWKEAAVAVYFCGEAARILGEDVEMLEDGEGLARHLGILREAGARLLGDGKAGEPDYAKMTEEIFRAESVAVW
jgi:hypothetical protein